MLSPNGCRSRSSCRVSSLLTARWARQACCSAGVSQWGCPVAEASGQPSALPVPVSVSSVPIWGNLPRDTVCSDRADRLVVIQSRGPGEPGVLARLADVDHREDAVPAVAEELGVDPSGVVAGHRAGGQPGRAHREDEVAGLQGRVEPRGRGALRIVGEDVLRARPVRDEFGGTGLYNLCEVSNISYARAGQAVGGADNWPQA